MLRVVIADDEAPARDKLTTLLQDLPEVEIVAVCANGTETIHAIRELRPAVLFLDVVMPGMNGFEVLSALDASERPATIVFTTAHDTFAIRAFEVNATDYLLKPFSRARLIEAVERARRQSDEPPHVRSERIDALIAMLSAQRDAPQRLPVSTNDGVEFIRTADIDWLQADSNYCRIVVGREELRVRGTLSNFEEMLSAQGFLRVHRSYLVNREGIVRIEPWANGEYVLVMRDGRRLNTGRGYGDAVRGLMQPRGKNPQSP